MERSGEDAMQDVKEKLAGGDEPSGGEREFLESEGITADSERPGDPLTEHGSDQGA